ncbi:MAG: hypothetical protein QW734_10125, partial [Candidatus Bathyarchaeia archaeon]
FSLYGGAMVKRISLTVSDDVYEKWVALSSCYNEDLQDAIKGVLEAISMNSRRIISLKDHYRVPVNLGRALMHIIDDAFHSLSLFDEVLWKMDVKGLYKLEDFEVDLDENYMRLFYSALAGCSLKIDEFDITVQNGSKRLSTFTYIEVGENNKRALNGLKKYVQTIPWDVTQLPEELENFEEYLEEFDIGITEGEEFWTLQIDCIADSFNDLPSIRRLSRFVERLLKKFRVRV